MLAVQRARYLKGLPRMSTLGTTAGGKNVLGLGGAAVAFAAYGFALVCAFLVLLIEIGSRIGEYFE